MIPLLSLIPGRTLLYAGVAAAALAGGLYALRQHDNVIRAEVTAVAQQAAAAAEKANNERVIAAMAAASAKASAVAASSAQIRSNIHAAPSSTSCAGSPAINAALAGLRHRAAAGGGPAGFAGKPDDLPAGTVAATGRH